jgi:hypothetical protein
MIFLDPQASKHDKVWKIQQCNVSSWAHGVLMLQSLAWTASLGPRLAPLLLLLLLPSVPGLQFAERYDANSYGSLVRRSLGKKTAACLSGVLLVYLWGSCVAYLVRACGDMFAGMSLQLSETAEWFMLDGPQSQQVMRGLPGEGLRLHWQEAATVQCG